MRYRFICSIAFVASATLLGQADQNSKKAPAPVKPIALSGCVARTPDDAGFTIEDTSGKYRLSGLDIHDFLGQKVQLLGAVVNSKKLKISGGLRPSANVAGQAGAIDPAQAATATAGGLAPTGNVQLPEFRVRSIKPSGEGCE